MKHKFKLYIHESQYMDELQVFPCDMTQYGHTLIHVAEVEVDVPDVPEVDRNALRIVALEKEEQKVRARFHVELTKIQNRIANLKSITHNPEVL